jgi:hypothetical protein
MKSIRRRARVKGDRVQLNWRVSPALVKRISRLADREGVSANLLGEKLLEAVVMVAEQAPDQGGTVLWLVGELLKRAESGGER